MPQTAIPTMSDQPPITVQPQPPGQVRAYPKPTKTGKIPFEYPDTGLKGETYYLLFGDLNSSKTPLICMHGGPGAGHQYLLPIALLSIDYSIPVILYDQIGCGGSTHFRDKKGDDTFWIPALFMAELDNLKSYFKIEKFDLLGQSWGGMLGGQYAIEKQPKGLNKLIISDSPCDMVTWVKVANELREDLPKDVRETLTRCEKEGKTETEEYEAAVGHYHALHVCRLSPWPKEFMDTTGNLKDDDTVYGTMNGPSEFYVIGSLKTWSIVKDLHKITEKTVPGGLLVINGYYDEAQDETCEAYFKNPTCKTSWIRYRYSVSVLLSCCVPDH